MDRYERNTQSTPGVSHSPSPEGTLAWTDEWRCNSIITHPSHTRGCPPPILVGEPASGRSRARRNLDAPDTAITPRTEGARPFDKRVVRPRQNRRDTPQRNYSCPRHTICSTRSVRDPPQRTPSTMTRSRPGRDPTKTPTDRDGITEGPSMSNLHMANTAKGETAKCEARLRGTKRRPWTICPLKRENYPPSHCNNLEISSLTPSPCTMPRNKTPAQIDDRSGIQPLAGVEAMTASLEHFPTLPGRVSPPLFALTQSRATAPPSKTRLTYPCRP